MSRVLVCGGREFDDEDVISEVMAEYLNDGDVVITGGARGADSIAHEVAKRNGFETEVYPAKWDLHGRSAGPIRNYEMLDTGIDLVIAFPGGRGTGHMVDIAKTSEVTVVEVLEDYR